MVLYVLITQNRYSNDLGHDPIAIGLHRPALAAIRFTRIEIQNNSGVNYFNGFIFFKGSNFLISPGSLSVLHDEW